MRPKTWFWISVPAILLISMLGFASGRDQGRGDRPLGDRESGYDRDGSGSEGYARSQSYAWRNDREREKEWREYLKEKKKAYKEWAKVNREEQREFEKYLRERRKEVREDMREREKERREADREYRERVREEERELWKDERERDKKWREYLRERNKAYMDYYRAGRQEQDFFHEYLRNRYGRYRDADGFYGNSRELRDGACFYMDSDYRGRSICLNRGERLRYVGGNNNDKISSIRIIGRASVIVYEHDDYDGSSRTYRDDARSLGSFNDKTSSIVVR